MTIETYFTMNARIVAILRQGNDPMALYAAQRIEELERISGIRYECLEIAIEALRWYGHNCPVLLCGKAGEALDDIEQRLAQLEPEEKAVE